MIRGSPSHVDLSVSELDVSVSFYDRFLGRLGYRRLSEAGAGAPCWGVTDDAGGVFSIALQPTKSEGGVRLHDRYSPGLHHLAFHADSRSDVDDFCAFVRDMGATILDDPAEYDYTTGYYAAFFADPDGLKLEIVHEPLLRGHAG